MSVPDREADENVVFRGEMPSDSTITNNMATSNGGGIVITKGQAFIGYCTIYSNTAKDKDRGEGGGIAIIGFGIQVSISDSILADNTAKSGADILGKIILYSRNLIQNVSGATLALSDGLAKLPLTGKPPDVGSLQYNGGSTQTRALLPNSPAIDQIPLNDITCAQLSTDQRGITRPQGKGCDLGAYEYVLVVH